MEATLVQPGLQQGVYTRNQAACLAKLRPQTASAWFETTGKRGPAVRRMMAANDDDLISFVDLIQMLAVRDIRRRQQPISLQKVREVVNCAKELGTTFPLARDTRVFLLGRDVTLKLPNGVLIGATGELKRQHLMEPVFLPYLQEITFGGDGLANEYRPLNGILITPTREWGAPIVEGTGYTVETLVAAARSEGDIDAAADICGVTPDQIKLALQYEEYLGVAA